MFCTQNTTKRYTLCINISNHDIAFTTAVDHAGEKITQVQIPFEQICLNGIATFTIDPELFQSTEWLVTIVKTSAIAFLALVDISFAH